MIFDEELINYLDLPEEYVDWMMVKITNESDFEIEADIMGHCLWRNDYYGKYKKGISDIYSLRDESNRPHATIEIILPDTVKQIQGKGNKAPKQEYLKLIQYWVNQNNFYS